MTTMTHAQYKALRPEDYDRRNCLSTLGMSLELWGGRVFDVTDALLVWEITEENVEELIGDCLVWAGLESEDEADVDTARDIAFIRDVVR